MQMNSRIWLIWYHCNDIALYARRTQKKEEIPLIYQINRPHLSVSPHSYASW